LKGLLTRHLHGIRRLFDFALQLDEIGANLFCSLLRVVVETHCDFYARLFNIFHNFQISTKLYCLAGTDSKLKGIEQALEEVQVSRFYIIFTYDS
jgi:hypothetical protein